MLGAPPLSYAPVARPVGIEPTTSQLLMLGALPLSYRRIGGEGEELNLRPPD